MFDTYGPFCMANHDQEGFEGLFAEIDAANNKLGNAVGVYIVTAAAQDGQQLPIYVGQTRKGFWHRLQKHYKMSKFAEILQERGPLGFFLLARATAKGKFLKSTDKKAINWLESRLIDRCLDINPLLMDVSEAAFHKHLYVPGFRDRGDKRNRDAKALGKLLKVD